MGKSPLWAAIDLVGVTATGTVTEGGVSGTDYNASYASTAMLLAATATVELSGWVATDEYFSSCFYLRLPTVPGADATFLEVFDQADVMFAEFKLTTGGEVEMWFDGVLLETLAVTTALNRYCLRVNTLEGRLQLIQNNADYLDALALDYTGITGISKLLFTGPVAATALSSIICDNEDTLTRYTVPLDFLAENGTYADLAGIVADLSDRSDTTGYVAIAVDDIGLFTHTPISSIGGSDISCLCLNASLGTLAAVAGFKFSVMLNDIIYDSAGTLTDVGFLTFATNPLDASDWSLGDINALEYGFKAV